MFVRSICAHCGKPQINSVSIGCIETTEFSDTDSATKYAIENIEIEESVTEEEFVRDILKTLRGSLKNGICIDELCKTLTEIFGVASAYCCDLIQRIKIELDMWCPDRKHLYFVS